MAEKTIEELQGLSVEEVRGLGAEDAEALWGWAVPRLAFHAEEAAHHREEFVRHVQERDRLRKLVRAAKPRPPRPAQPTRATDLVGRVYGRLTIVSRAPGKYQNKVPLWNAACLCGREKVVNSKALKAGDSRSCGCLSGRVPPLNPINEAAL
jgi:hypothetical protein